MSTPTLPLNLVIDVSVQIDPIVPASPQFNQALIIGTTPVIPSSQRIRSYTTTALTQMAVDGFQTNDPEYIAAGIYFAQNANGEQPQYLQIGRQDLTALSTTGTNLHEASAGTGYQVGDILTVVQLNASGGQVEVTAVNNGVPTSISVVQGSQGTGYSLATGLATTGGHGTGCQVDLISVGETPLQALQACRAASSAWWGCSITGSVTADHEAIAPYVQSVSPSACYFYTTQDANVLTGSGDVLSTLKAANYNRVFGMYSTTQNGLAPNNVYAAIAAMGVAMGLNTGLANSYFTMKFKELVGITTEPLSLNQITTIEGNNGNLYLSYSDSYSWLEQGVMANGQFFDELLNLDMLASNIQYNVADLFTSTPALPLTNSGQSSIINAVNKAGATAASIGFLSPGTWKGQTVLNVSAGTPIPRGYMTVSPSFSTQSVADRDARKAMPCYMLITESGAAHSLLVGVYIQR